MNGIENITSRIITEAREKASEILARAQAEVNEIKANFDEVAREEAAEILEKGKAAAKERETRLGGVAELEARKIKLKTKREMIDAAFNKTVELLKSQPEDEYTDTLVRLALKASETGSEQVILSEADREKIGDRLIGAINKKLKVQNPQAAGLSLADETRGISGGLILKSGDMEINASFETIVEKLKDEIAHDVADILFN